MTMIALIFLALCQIQGIFGDVYNNGHLPVVTPELPAMSRVCKYDPFMASESFNGKVFLFPYETRDQRGNWLRNYGYCAAHCAEMVTIHSQEENKFFLDFMRNSVFDALGLSGSKTAIWLGAQVENMTFTQWTNGEGNDYSNNISPEFNEDGVTCLNAALEITNDNWFNNYCDVNVYFLACQRPTPWTPNKAPACYRTNDLIIVLDSSGSIGDANYKKAKSFVSELARAYAAQSDSRVAVILYSRTVFKLFGLTNTLSSTDMTSTIVGAQYLRETTMTHLGINAALKEFDLYKRTVPLNLVVLTDGVSNYPISTKAAAVNAASKGVRMFAVGMGIGVNKVELMNIANGDAERVFQVNRFDDLESYLIPVSRAICKP